MKIVITALAFLLFPSASFAAQECMYREASYDDNGGIENPEQCPDDIVSLVKRLEGCSSRPLCGGATTVSIVGVDITLQVMDYLNYRYDCDTIDADSKKLQNKYQKTPYLNVLDKSIARKWQQCMLD